MGVEKSAEVGGRARVLEVLVEHGPATLRDLEELTGLHASTLREHLAGLAGQVTRVRRPTPGRGRPAWAYAARSEAHIELARVLADALASGSGDPAEAARVSGRGWGERVLAQLGPDPTGNEWERLVLALEHAGFAPHGRRPKAVIDLGACPVVELARRHTDIVCNAHLGLVEGVTGRDGSADIQPFVGPSRCIVRLLEEPDA